ncbi:ABC-type multidrug transport system, ATPase and permease component [Paramicrobacterium humi]|uniref:ABC-type multidrug transport system, ATPase and permease component n=1 Tax=Paramicrobacterium humi TaxID=640635 RepID=A0A1H4KJ07_9MICO|nr:ABC transporter ATP-binding protein [Microbacterium humi]SEB58058.1 ABC-type multidrug transport system, ATPase and permease component [Microbacterium humi]
MSAKNRDRPPVESVGRFLLWQASRQPKTLVGGVVFGVIWMLCQAVWPYLLGRAIDEGIDGGQVAVLAWCLALLLVACVQAASGMMRHRMAVSNWLRSSLGVSRVIGHHSADTGNAITATTASGEIVATVSSDALRLGEMFDVTARLSGGIIAYLVVSVIMLTTSVPLGLVVLIGVPVLGALLGLVIKPLHKRQAGWRKQTGLLTTLGADTVAGLRVLRGIGGEDEFVERYAARSQKVRKAGVRVARMQSWLDGLQVVLPGAFLAFIVWFGAHLVLSGAISAGELVAFYGYAVFLTIPLRTGVEAAQAFARGIVAGQRILAVLRIERATSDPDEPAPPPPAGSELVDVASGLTVRPGLFTGVVDVDPDTAAAVATRLGRFDDTLHEDAPVLWGGVEHTRLPVSEVRRRIVVSGANPQIFGGPLLESLDILPLRDPDLRSTQTGQIRRVRTALDAAAATETVDALPEGLSETVAERGRSFSGGQRQRLSLARALITDAEVLVLIEPTSAVDSHTEALISERLRRARAGRTTVIVTESPLLLDHMDDIEVMRRGSVIGRGTHGELMRRDDDVGDLYRSVVARTTSAAEPVDAGELDEAWTGSIDALWTDAVETGAIRTAKPRRERGDDDASADR